MRIAAASDAPGQLSDLLQLYASVEKNVQIRANLNRVKTEVDTAERPVALAVQIVERAAVLTSKGTGTIETAQSRRILAEEVRCLLEERVAISRTRVEGRYIFSGVQDGEPLYELTLTNPSGATRMFNALAALRVAAGHLNIRLSFYGNVQRKVAEAPDGASKLDLQLKLELSAKWDADLTVSALELRRARTHEEAALQALARLPDTSLADFLG